MAVTLTETAAREVKTILQQQEAANNNGGGEATKLYLRVGVKGGGCSGFSYSLDLTEDKSEDDELWNQHGVDVICDPKSLLYLDNTTVDFKDEMMGRGFVFNNPNQSSACGWRQSSVTAHTSESARFGDPSPS